MPRHIAIIMDGNGRWAKKQGKLRVFGHEHGVDTVRQTVENCVQIGLEYLTLYTFSTENWKRPKLEIDTLMRLLVSSLKKELPTFIENNVKLLTVQKRNTIRKRFIKIENSRLNSNLGPQILEILVIN